MPLYRKTKLYALRKYAEVRTVRNHPSTPEERAQAIVDLKTSDLAGKWGVAQVRQRLANSGILIRRSVNFLHLSLSVLTVLRDETRQVLHDHFDEEFDARFVGSKDAIDRFPLNCLGPWHQLHGDGHEKLAAQALMMGGVGLAIYAMKDQYSTFVPVMRVIPNVRLGNTIGHFYLDLVEEYGCMSWTFP